MKHKKTNNNYLKTKDWINTTINSSELASSYYKEMFDEEIIEVPIPKGVNPPNWGAYRKFTKAFVATIDNGSIWKDNFNFFVVTPDKKLLCDLVFEGWWDNFIPNNMPESTLNISSATILTGSATNNYYHWLFDILPRIHLIKLNGMEVEKYVFEKLKWPIQFETLEKLGIPQKKILQIESPNSHIKADKLIVASIPELSGSCPKWANDFVRETFLNSKQIAKINEFERIYISREDANWRKVSNEEEVTNYLVKKGFKKVALTNMSLDEQINIFNSAQIIVSPNGAQLGNLVFCNPGAIIIELFNQTTGEFFNISHYLKLDYFHLKCKAANNQFKNKALHDSGPPEFLRNNFFVNIKELEYILKLVGI
ncbi:glycosyltransferase family 61 protein [Niallia nealsonii]|uniref:Glycosyltransferase 61 catalytic domain-containing protein n=1 Tax=Niallia nealsonii TaxID=115979 RepID=A0A2N0YZS4_9BACI|nr:glycosyltransferase family 61 protein [Niallia nealsonii]PKG22762.1 hypothetical protein CWS01_15265 [Niallia nealsonii]